MPLKVIICSCHSHLDVIKLNHFFQSRESKLRALLEEK